jgi:hypothetical protein
MDPEQLMLEDSSDPVVSVNREEELAMIRETIQRLNPAASNLDEFTNEQQTRVQESTPVSVNLRDVIEVLRDLPVGSACGSSGWSFAAIRSLFFELQCRGSIQSQRQAATYTQKFANAMLNGRKGASRVEPS